MAAKKGIIILALMELLSQGAGGKDWGQSEENRGVEGVKRT